MSTATRRVYVAIMKAADKGVGLRLTADEVSTLSFDSAIATAASNDLTEAENSIVSDRGWKAVQP
jgi:hypothetical protein